MSQRAEGGNAAPEQDLLRTAARTVKWPALEVHVRATFAVAARVGSKEH